MQTINCNGKLIDLSSPKIMGILNITDDSFYDGGKFNTTSKAISHVRQMLVEGADIIDIGAQSTRPRATQLSDKEEIIKLSNLIPILKNEFPNIIISIDTFYGNTAKFALDSGADIINDISGGDFDPSIWDVAADYKCPYILMHHQGTPTTMQINPSYNNLLEDVWDYFIQKIGNLKDKGIHDIIIDVGYGFGKTIDHNYTLMSNCDLFLKLNLPLLTGISRKSMVYKLFNGNASDALNGTTAINMFALIKGSKILRVHDVKAAKELVIIYNKLTNSSI